MKPTVCIHDCIEKRVAMKEWALWRTEAAGARAAPIILYVMNVH